MTEQIGATSATAVPMSPLLRLPAELRNLIYAYALTADKGLNFHPSWGDGLRPPRFFPRSTSPATRSDEFNQLKYTCRQLHQETAGLEVQTSQTYFNNTTDVRGPAETFVKFRETCTVKKAGWFRDVTLLDDYGWGPRDVLDHNKIYNGWALIHFLGYTPEKYKDLLEPRQFMHAVVDFCRNYKEHRVRYESAKFDLRVPCGLLLCGLHLNLEFRGNDLRSAVATSDLPQRGYRRKELSGNNNSAAEFRVENLRYCIPQTGFDHNHLKSEYELFGWLHASDCADLAQGWYENGI